MSTIIGIKNKNKTKQIGLILYPPYLLKNNFLEKKMCLFQKSVDFLGKSLDLQNNIIQTPLGNYILILDSHLDIGNISSSGDFNDGNKRIKVKKGIYIFVVCKDYDNFNPHKFNKIESSSIPPLGNWSKGTKIVRYNLKKGQIFYIGSNISDCTGRCFQHINTSKNTSNGNLRLAHEKRKFIKKYLRVVFIDCAISQNEKMIEKNIRNTYSSFFGQ